MGYPPLEHSNIPEVQDAIKRVLAATKAAGKYAGMFCASGEQVNARFEQGCECSRNGGGCGVFCSCFLCSRLHELGCRCYRYPNVERCRIGESEGH